MLLFSLLACSTWFRSQQTVELGGEVPPDPVDGFAWTISNDGEPVEVNILWTDIPDACATFTDYYAARFETADVAAAAELLPDDYWLWVFEAASDGATDISGDYGPDGNLRIHHQVNGYEIPGTGDDEIWQSDAGTFRLDFVSDKQVDLETEGTVFSTDATGTFEVELSADHCESIEALDGSP